MPAVIKGKNVSQVELAAIFGVSVETIRSWVAIGCPVVAKGGKGRANTFNTADVIAWREQRAVLASGGTDSAMDLADARKRKVIAETEMLEMDVGERKRLLVRVDLIFAAVSAGDRFIKNALLGLGYKLAPRVAASKDPNVIKDLIDKEVHQALANLSQADLLRGKAEAVKDELAKLDPLDEDWMEEEDRIV